MSFSIASKLGLSALCMMMSSVALAGCVSETGDDDSQADEGALTQNVSFELLQKGFFAKPSSGGSGGVRAYPRMIHTGTISQDGKTWSNVQDFPISYDAEGRNLPVKAKIAAAQAKQPFAFTIQSKEDGGNTETWSDVQIIDPARPAGKFINLPVTSGAGYPFSPECYSISIITPQGTLGSTYPGKIAAIHYGFTKATQAEYDKNNDISWENGRGKESADGVRKGSYVHDGGYKGSYGLVPAFIRVPADRNLVFKLDIEKYGGSCANDGDTQSLGNAQTQTYFFPTKTTS